MSKLFSTDSLLWRALSKMTDLIWLNILFVVCSIPIFTIGASLSAMYSVTFKMTVGEEGAISQDFFKAFRENFKQATILWLIMLGIGIFIVVDLFFAAYLPGAFRDGAHILLAVIGVLYLLTFSYVFPLQSRFINPIKLTMLNALVISTKHLFPSSIAATFLTAIPGLIVAFLPHLIIDLLPIIVLFLFAGIAFVVSKILRPIFQKYIDLQAQRQQEEAQQKELQDDPH